MKIRTSVAIGLTAFTIACEPSEAPDQAVTVRDSAGIEIVTNATVNENRYLPVALSNLAFAEEGLGSPDKADAHFRRAIEVAQRVLGEDHPETEKLRGNYARFLKRREQN